MDVRFAALQLHEHLVGPGIALGGERQLALLRHRKMIGADRDTLHSSDRLAAVRRTAWFREPPLRLPSRRQGRAAEHGSADPLTLLVRKAAQSHPLFIQRPLTPNDAVELAPVRLTELPVTGRFVVA